MNWDQYFMSMVYLVAMKSKDPSTKVGAIIIGPDHEIRSTGFNGLPRNVNDAKPERYQKPIKYFWIEHSERNSVYNAARIGIDLNGCTMYTQGTPCVDCARAIIQSGIKKVVVDSVWDRGDNRPEWIESLANSKTMLTESGIEFIEYNGPLIDKIQGFKSGTILERIPKYIL